MGTGNISAAFKIVIFVITAIIVCAVCAAAISTANSGRAIADSSTSGINKIAAQNASITETQYDRNSLLGSEIVSLIEDSVENKDELSIIVKTLRGSTQHYNYDYNDGTKTISPGGRTAFQTDISGDDYINRNSLYLCTVIKDRNGSIIGLRFEQQ